MANDQDTFHADLCELLTILGMGDHSRSQSPHEVFQEALGVLRERLSLPAPNSTPPCLGEREAVARIVERNLNQTAWPFTHRVGYAADTIIAEHIEPLRIENETLRARVEEARRATDSVRQAMLAKFDTATRLADERYHQLRSAEAERDAAIARAEEAEGKLADLKLDVELNERPLYSRRQIIAERDEARTLAYELKLAAAGGEDVPGAAHAVTVEDVARWRDEAWTRTDALDRDVAKAKRALALTLAFVDRAAGEGLAFLEGENGEPAQDAADICFAVADIFVIEDLDSDEFRALTTPEHPHGD